MTRNLGGDASNLGGALVPLAPPVNTGVPRVARVYNALLGDDRDAFACEREAAAKVLAANPDIKYMVRANRLFLGRAVRYAVKQCGIRQLLDVGSGYPTQDNVHEVARSVARGVKTVYVDSDEIVAAHGRALLADDQDTFFIQADLRRAGELLWSSKPLLDFSRPVALFLVAVLHFIPPEDEPYEVVADLVAALAPGSLLVISHVLDVPSMRQAARVYDKASSPGVPRSLEEVRAFFSGVALVEPGLVPLTMWRTNEDDMYRRQFPDMPVVCGVGRKP
ncbi:SAM-dependent methyltransferase [Sphaerisporangium sp. NPDC004334]